MIVFVAVLRYNKESANFILEKKCTVLLICAWRWANMYQYPFRTDLCQAQPPSLLCPIGFFSLTRMFVPVVRRLVHVSHAWFGRVICVARTRETLVMSSKHEQYLRLFQEGRGWGALICWYAIRRKHENDCSLSSNRLWRDARCLDMERVWRLNVQTGSISTCLIRDYLQNCIKQYMAKWCDYNDNNNKAPSLNHSVFSTCVCVCILFVESKALGKRLRNVTLNWCGLTLWLQECLFLALPEAKCW